MSRKFTRKIALVNQKGGVGKTTSTVNIGAGLRRLGKTVLLVDFDPQANLTAALGIPADRPGKTVYDLIRGNASVDDVIVSKEGLEIIPSSIELSAADVEFIHRDGKEMLLKERLASLHGYDFVLIDCPPSLGFLTLNALVEANEVLIPVQADFLSLQGVSRILEVTAVVRNRLNSGLAVTGIFITRYHKRRLIHREVREELQKRFANKLFSQTIGERVALAEAPGFGCDIFTYKPNSIAAQEYYSLCQELIMRGCQNGQ